jgi:hypothetical protein
MTRRKIALGLGFAAIGLLLVEYVVVITWLWLNVPPEEGKGVIGIVVLASGAYVLPALTAAIFLLVGRKNPQVGGTLEMWEGGLGLALGLLFLVSVSVGPKGDDDIFNIFTFFPLLGSGGLFLISGLLFLIVQKKKEFFGSER